MDNHQKRNLTVLIFILKKVRKNRKGRITAREINNKYKGLLSSDDIRECIHDLLERNVNVDRSIVANIEYSDRYDETLKEYQHGIGYESYHLDGMIYLFGNYMY